MTRTVWVWATNETPPCISEQGFPTRETCVADLRAAVGDAYKLIESPLLGLYEWGDEEIGEVCATVTSITIKE